MKTFRIQIYTNRISTDLTPYLTTMFQYYKEHGVILNYDITPVDVTGYKSTLTNTQMAGTVYTIQSANTLLPKNDHDITWFVYDLNEWKAPFWWPYPLWGNVPRDCTDLIDGKPFTTIGFLQSDIINVQQRMIHEPMHDLAKIFGCPDVMDTYLEDNNPRSLTGNFSQQWNIFKPYLNEPMVLQVKNVTYDVSKWSLVPQLAILAIKFLTQCSDAGYSLKITQGLRTMAQQQALYDQGRTKSGNIVTNAKPGQSQHNFGKAFDVCFTGTIPYPTDDKKWRAIADIGVSLGLTAGYYFKSFQDRPHFEIK